MKAVNILSLANAKKDLSQSVIDSYLKNFEIKTTEDELNDLFLFVNKLFEYSQELYIFEGFFFGYSINQISKEFDLLRFGQDDIINIELKSKNTGEKMKKQLKKNQYYLSFLEKEIFSFTYVTDEEKLYYLDNKKDYKEVDFLFLIDHLHKQVLQEIEDVDKLFDPTNYLVSPFNSTDAFIEGSYFLTDHQQNIKSEVLSLSAKSGPCFISIQGAAGTGKTLLIYDIAKEYIKHSKKVLIFHCGKLNDGQIKLSTKYSWSIAPIKDLKNYDLNTYEIIIIDEVQRIYLGHLKFISKNLQDSNIKCIFSYDPKQCLTNKELNRKIPKVIKDKFSPEIYTLTEKIRTNEEIASFIKNLFALSKINPNKKYRNVNVKYFSNLDEAKKYIQLLNNQGWKTINYTTDLYKPDPYDDYEIPGEDNAHQVIGQEYDNVIVIIDKHFFYNKKGKLVVGGFEQSPFYSPLQMLFQKVTRARKKLCIIIINNEVLLDKCLKILQN